MADDETTTVMISKTSAKRAKVIAAHEDKTIRQAVEEAIDYKFTKSRAVPAESKAELAEK